MSVGPISPVPKGEGPGAPGTRFGSDLVFEFDGDDADLGRAYVSESVGREGQCEKGRSRSNWYAIPAVERYGAVLVAPDEVATTENVKRGGPAVSVERRCPARLDDGVEYANAIVLEEELVVFGRGGQRIEF